MPDELLQQPADAALSPRSPQLVEKWRPRCAPYSVRTKKVGGKVYTQIYVPSTISKDGIQNYAWIELVDPPVGDEALGLSADEVLALLYDPMYVLEWKVAYLRTAYLSFRAAENARNRGDLSCSDWEVEVHYGPQYLNVSVHEDQVDSKLVVDWLLSQVSAKQAEHIRLHVFEQLSFVQIVQTKPMWPSEPTASGARSSAP